MLLDRIGPPAEVPRVNLLCHPYAREGQAVVCPLLRGSSPTRGVAPKQHRGLRRAFSPAFRAGGIPLSLGAWVPQNLARRSFGLLVSAARCCSTGSGRLLRGPALTSFVTLTRARARQWSARCYGVARQREGSRQNSTGPFSSVLETTPIAICHMTARRLSSASSIADVQCS